MRLAARVLTLLTLSSSILAQTMVQDPEKPLKSGVVNGLFTNERLGVSFPVAERWVVISTAESELLSSAGFDMLKQSDKANVKKIDEAAANSIKLVVLAEKPYGSLENSSLELVAALQPKGVTATMVMVNTASLFKGTPFQLKRSLTPLKLGGRTFAAAEFEGTFSNIKFNQRVYVIMHRGYSLLFSAAYFTESQRVELEKLIAGLTLK